MYNIFAMKQQDIFLIWLHFNDYVEKACIFVDKLCWGGVNPTWPTSVASSSWCKRDESCQLRALLPFHPRVSRGLEVENEGS